VCRREMISISTLPVYMVPGSTATLILEYTGTYPTQGYGLYLSAPSPRTPALVVTQFETTGARAAFPCFDEPALKAPFTASLVVPRRAGLAALANMPEIGRTIGRGGAVETVSFAPSPPISTYLVAFTVGQLVQASSTVSGRDGPVNHRRCFHCRQHLM
jgi:puromycin-sensitive aminopeptidase